MAKEEQIRSAINSLDDGIAKDALALLLAGGGVQTKVSSSIQGNNDSQSFANFAQAILWLKSKYKFQELNAFSTEADLVYVNTGDRRVLLTDTSVPGANKSEPAPEAAKPSSVEDDVDNAFEPIQKNGRFNNLEL